MVSGDHYICNSCHYEWRTRKDVGEPHQCPKCHNSYIEEEGARRTRIAREAEEESVDVDTVAFLLNGFQVK